jgi:hypothetical protein
MPEVTLRFGEIKTPSEELPSLDALADDAERRGIVGDVRDRQGAREVFRESDYLFFEYVREVREEVSQFNAADEVVVGDQYLARVMRFLLIGDGTYVFESRRGVTNEDAIRYLLQPHGTSYQTEIFDSLSRKRMKRFYESREQVRRLKVNNVGERKPNPHWPDEHIRDLVENTGESTDNSEFSVGRKDRNLKDAELIDDGFVELSDLSVVRARDSEGNIQELRDTGRFSFTYPSDLDPEEQSRLIRTVAIEVIRDLFFEDE